MIANNPPELNYARAFDIIWHNQHTSLAEKAVLTEVCRYWPRPYHGSNATISAHTGLSQRAVQYCLKSLSTGPEKRQAQGKPARRAYIDRGYGHVTLNGKTYTCRVILPICLPGKAVAPQPLGAKNFTRQDLTGVHGVRGGGA